MDLKGFKLITITYEPSNQEVNRICGHLFEAFDLYLFLKENLTKNIKILIQDKIKNNLIKQAFEDKYSLSFSDIQDDIIFSRKKLYASKIFINTSGANAKDLLKYKFLYFISFRCNPYKELVDRDKFFYFYDTRVYEQFDKNINFKKSKIIHSVKKFYFKYYKKINTEDNKKLIYLNSNLRKINIEYYKNKFNNVLFVSGNKLIHSDVLNAPVLNLFERFDTYIYTPISRNFDCSPRLLTESYYYNKKIQFDFDFNEYAKPNAKDSGLYWRWFDIKNNFENLFYNKNDNLLKFLKGLI